MSNTLTDPLLGRLVDGRYEVRERIAAGGMATVYLAFDKRLHREVALKIMHERLAESTESGEFVAHFRREARAAARLTHPGLVRVYDQGVDGDLSYITMEFVRGETLRQRLHQEATLAVGEALAIAEGVLDALAAAHREGLVHRDIKPENILLDEDGQPRITDFGLTRAVTEVTSTSTGTIMGTVAYLGPELVARGHSDARTDVYALGVVLFEMITGRQPFTAASAIDLASRHVHEDVPPPSSHVPWLPPELDALVARLVARNPDARPEDAVAALGELRRMRAMMDDPTLDRMADPPSGAIRLQPTPSDETTVLEAFESGSTVALPIGLGEPLPDLASSDADLIDDDPEAVEPEEKGPRLGLWVGALIAAALALSAFALWWYNSAGPGAYTTVPPVASNNTEDARSILEAVDLDVALSFEFNDDVPEGIVISTNPPAQSQVLNGATITLNISQGPQMEEVPPLTGLTEAEALLRLRDTSFRYGESARVHSDTVPEGQVIAQTQATGAVVPHDTEISLTVSLGPEPIIIPDVTGRELATAEDLLQVFALEVTVVRERTLEEPKGIVFAQTPDPGSAGVRTQSITIFVSDGKPMVTVPELRGLSLDEARGAAAEANIQLDEVRANIPGRTRRIILEQETPPGEQVEHGSTITVYYY